MSPLFLRLAAACLLLAPLLAACGGDDDATPSGGLVTQTANAIPSVGAPQEQPPPVQELSSEPAEPSDGVIEIAVSGQQFEQNYLKVQPGDSVTIRLTNNDDVPHNMRLAGIDGQFDTEDDALTSPDKVDPGQVGELTFAPPTAGVYTFRCDFHPDIMGGEIVVGDATPIPALTPEPTEAPADDTSGG
jgi:plastocyanin